MDLAADQVHLAMFFWTVNKRNLVVKLTGKTQVFGSLDKIPKITPCFFF
jgi:hypothetical protein